MADANPPSSNLRVSGADSAHDLFDEMRSQHDVAATAVEDIVNLIEGALPDDPEWLEANGMEDAANVNWRKAENVVEVRESIYHNRVHLEETFATFTSTLKGLSKERRMDVSTLISKRFTEMLKDTPDFVLQRSQHRKRYVRTGHGHMYWPSPVSFIPESIRFSMLVLPSDTPVWPEKWDVFFILGTETISSLYRRVRNSEAEQTSAEVGWNPSEVKRTIYSRSNKVPTDDKGVQLPYSDDNYSRYLETLTGNSLAHSHLHGETIPVVHMFTKEFDDTWSRRTFVDDPETVGYLVEKEGAYSSVKEIFAGYWMYIQDDELHYSVQGAINKMYNEIVVNNSIMNSLVDLLDWVTSIVVEGGNIADPDAHEFKKRHNMILTPTGTQFSVDLMKALDSTGALNVFRLLDSNLERKQMMNASALVSSVDSKQPVAAQEIKTQQNNITDFHAAEMLTFDTQDTHFYSEVYRRVMSSDYGEEHAGWDQVKRFREQLKEDGVSAEEMNPDNLVVHPTPSIGLGNTEFRRAAVEVLMQNIGMFDAVGQDRIKRLWTMSYAGVDGAHALLPDTNPFRASGSERIAFFENLFLQQGQRIPALSEDDHVNHFAIHGTPILQIADQAQESGQVNGEELAPYLLAAVEHLSAHFELARQDNTAASAINQMGDALKRIENFTRQVLNFAQQQAQQAAQQQEPPVSDDQMLEHQRKLAEIDLKHRERLADLDHRMKEREIKTAEKIRIGREKEAAEAQ